MTIDEILELDKGPKLPESRERGIGIVGAGAIVNAGHLPSYRKAGFNVVAIADTNLEAAQETAREWGVPAAYRSVDELLEDSKVEVVDIAVTPNAQFQIASKAFEAGRHALCQKPLAETLEPAIELVQRAERAGVRMAVNQQMRWEGVVRTAKLLIDAGWYGELIGGLFDVNIMEHHDRLAHVAVDGRARAARVPLPLGPLLRQHPPPLRRARERRRDDRARARPARTGRVADVHRRRVLRHVEGRSRRRPQQLGPRAARGRPH
ncbi:MAG: Gfo/Idh/MocA family oxidoreductase [Actinobacteria bacterium]|nr:MAG: Gfo/Idh/MocA family oxidoreductase [Actinomycetota bacterium]